jgi:hypothetical protein
MSMNKKVTLGVAAIAAIAIPLTACSGSNSDKKPVATITNLDKGQTTSVALDAGFLKDLTALKLTPGVVGTAKLANGSLIFPITGGHVTVYKKGKVTPYVQGEIDHNGSGISLTAGATTVTLKNFVIDPGNNSVLTGEVDVNGAVAVKSAPLFDLDGTTLQPITIDSAGVATLTGTRVLISSAAAGLLDTTFKTTAVTKGLLVGVATIKAASK